MYNLKENIEEEKLELLEKSIVPYLQWIRLEVFALKNESILKKTVGFAGVTSGIVAASVNLILSYDFGQWLASKAGIQDKNICKAIGGYFAVTAYVPIAILAARTSRLVFCELVSKTSNEEKKITLHPTKVRIIKQGFNLYIWTLAAIAAVADVYNTYEEFNKYIGLWSLIFMVPDFFSPLAINVWAYSSLNKTIYSNIKKNMYNRLPDGDKKNFQRIRVQVTQKMQRSIEIIEKMTASEIDALFNNIFRAQEDSCLNEEMQDQITIQKIKLLFHPSDRFNNYVSPGKSAGKIAVNIAGGVIGGISAYVYWPLAKAAVEKTLDLFGVTNSKVRSVVSSVGGASALLCRGALAAYTSSGSFEKFYSWFAELPQKFKNLFNRVRLYYNGTADSNAGAPVSCRAYLRGGLSLLSVIICVSASTSRAEQVIETTDTTKFYGKFLLLCALLGTFGIRLWSMETFFDELMYGKTNKQKLINSLNQMIDMVSEMSDEYVEALNNMLADGAIEDHFMEEYTFNQNQPRT